MTRSGILFIDEAVRDHVEQMHRHSDVLTALNNGGYSPRFREHGTGFSRHNNPIDYPERGQAIIHIPYPAKDDELVIGTIEFTITRTVESGMGGNYVQAHPDAVAVAWRWDILHALGIDTDSLEP